MTHRPSDTSTPPPAVPRTGGMAGCWATDEHGAPCALERGHPPPHRFTASTSPDPDTTGDPASVGALPRRKIPGIEDAVAAMQLDGSCPDPCTLELGHPGPHDYSAPTSPGESRVSSAPARVGALPADVQGDLALLDQVLDRRGVPAGPRAYRIGWLDCLLGVLGER